MNRENFTFNETLNTCFIKPNEFYPNGSYYDYEKCPESYSNLTKSFVFKCCLQIIINRLEDSYSTKIQGWLTYHSSMLLIGPAVIFNLISLLVLSRFSKLNASATSISFYMQCLCVFDSLTMLSKFLNEFIVVKNSIRLQPFKINAIVCKLSYFSESIFGITSIYILILMSIDKLICVAFPLRSSSLLRPKKAKLMCLLVMILSMIYSTYHLFTQTVLVTMKRTSNINTTDTTVYECIFADSNLESKMKIADNFIRVFVPIILLCICNILIVIIIAKSRKMFLTESPSVDDEVQIKYVKNKNKETVMLNNQNNTVTEEILSSDNVQNRTEKSKFIVNESKYNQKSARIRHKHSKTDKNSHYISGIVL